MASVVSGILTTDPVPIRMVLRMAPVPLEARAMAKGIPIVCPLGLGGPKLVGPVEVAMEMGTTTLVAQVVVATMVATVVVVVATTTGTMMALSK